MENWKSRRTVGVRRQWHSAVGNAVVGRRVHGVKGEGSSNQVTEMAPTMQGGSDRVTDTAPMRREVFQQRRRRRRREQRAGGRGRETVQW